MSLDKLKNAFRKKAKLSRSCIHERIGSVASHKISRYIEDFLLTRTDLEVVAAYFPIQSEIDIRPIIPKIRKLGRILCLPVVTVKDQPLKFVVWNENIELMEGRFRVLVPASGEIIEPDLILCPMLSFDSRGYRLGYGGGFYDRTIDYLTRKKHIFSLGCAYSQQTSSKFLPIGDYDKPLDAVATENGITFFSCE